uniref:DUF4939 domain-containing protein n=1 Tax=Sander lucioperca TaxID=283035 RepID=A0A8C9YB56_SANLU
VNQIQTSHWADCACSALQKAELKHCVDLVGELGLTLQNQQYVSCSAPAFILCFVYLFAFPVLFEITVYLISGHLPSLPLAASSPFPHLARPERFSGDSGDRRAFLTQCELHSELQAAAYPSDRAKVAFIISHLSGRAESWAAAEWSENSVACDSYSCFTKTFTRIFQHVTPGREAARALVGLRYSIRRRLLHCHPTDLMTAPLTCCLVPPLPRAGCFLCHLLKWVP